MKRKVFGVFGTVCLILAMVSVLGAQVDVMSVGPATLKAANDIDLQLVFPVWFDLGVLQEYWGAYVTRTGGWNYFLVPLDLPEGKIIKWLKLHFFDNSTTSGWMMECTLVRANKYIENGMPQEIYKVDTTGSWGDVVSQKTDLTPAQPSRAIVINRACHYYLQIDFNAASGGNLRFYGASIGIQ